MYLDERLPYILVSIDGRSLDIAAATGSLRTCVYLPLSSDLCIQLPDKSLFLVAAQIYMGICLATRKHNNICKSSNQPSIYEPNLRLN